MMILLEGDGSITSTTASQISFAKSSSVPVNDSGEYSYQILVSGTVDSRLLQYLAASTAIFLIPSRSSPKTTFR